VSTVADEVDLELHEVTGYDEQPSTQEEGITLTSFTDGLHDAEHDVTEFTLHTQYTTDNNNNNSNVFNVSGITIIKAP